MLLRQYIINCSFQVIFSPFDRGPLPTEQNKHLYFTLAVHLQHTREYNIVCVCVCVCVCVSKTQQYRLLEGYIHISTNIHTFLYKYMLSA